MNKLEEFDESRLIKNPFEFTLKIPVTQIYSDTDLTLDEEGFYINKKIYLERTPSVKLYYCEDCKDMIYNLTVKGKTLFLYILYNLKKNKDYIQINQEHYMKKNSINSINTYKESIKELQRYNFIVATEYKTVFWTNPNLFFSGNRLTKYPNNIEVKHIWD